LSAAKNEVDEEIRLASEQEAHYFRGLQLIEFKETQRHRLQHLDEIQESHLHRSKQRAEAKANQLFRSEQLLTLVEFKELQVQKVIKEEGKSTFILCPIGYD